MFSLCEASVFRHLLVYMVFFHVKEKERVNLAFCCFTVPRLVLTCVIHLCQPALISKWKKQSTIRMHATITYGILSCQQKGVTIFWHSAVFPISCKSIFSFNHKMTWTFDCFLFPSNFILLLVIYDVCTHVIYK
jgi:hypothetical protein